MSSQVQTPFGFLPSGLRARLEDNVRIRDFFLEAASFYLRGLWINLRHGHLSVLFGKSNHETREQTFAACYSSLSKPFTDFESTTVVPQLVTAAHGIVLDLGPGSGNQIERFDASKIEHVYGVEPNTAFTDFFMKRLAGTKLGVDGKYTLVHCGIEESDVLARYGIVEGSVDCVVSMQVMCSLPRLDEHIRHMYRLLKPGGELIFWEHCRNPDPVTRVVQWLWSLLWPTVIGGCRLDRVTRDIVVNAANWEVIDVHMDCEPHKVMPRVWGRLVKPKAT